MSDPDSHSRSQAGDSRASTVAPETPVTPAGPASAYLRQIAQIPEVRNLLASLPMTPAGLQSTNQQKGIGLYSALTTSMLPAASTDNRASPSSATASTPQANMENLLKMQASLGLGQYVPGRIGIGPNGQVEVRGEVAGSWTPPPAAGTSANTGGPGTPAKPYASMNFPSSSFGGTPGYATSSFVAASTPSLNTATTTSGFASGVSGYGVSSYGAGATTPQAGPYSGYGAYAPSYSSYSATGNYASSSNSNNSTAAPVTAVIPSAIAPPSNAAQVGEDGEDGEAGDDFFPEMADDDYSAQLNWSGRSKDNLKVLMDNFTPEQYDRFEAYRRNALPKGAVRKVIQQSLAQQVSQPVAQIVAGVAKVFVGEVVEKARKIQARQGQSGPLTPDHLREAYRQYQMENGRIGPAKKGAGKKLFVR